MMSSFALSFRIGHKMSFFNFLGLIFLGNNCLNISMLLS